MRSKKAENILNPGDSFYAYEVETKKGKENLEIELDSRGKILKAYSEHKAN
ncbi:PepSY domain-containing protein [Methyloterricola oryzae]|uniref:PepSY domain-containing protein n=1 Tax=Methyloterricola oryzae TaxID=1495050 RepID=UPI00130130B6|nr:PepSY domain-containing protein [Methyloterricola oryzae]